MRYFAIGALACGLSGCVAVPGAGPTAGGILERASVEIAQGDVFDNFALFTMNIDMAQRINALRPAPAFAGDFFADAPPPPFLLAPGDTVAITIVSVDANGFLDFTQSALSPLSSTSLPNQIIEADGRVQVPPLGRVRAAGLSPQALETSLKNQLGAVLIDPSVVVQAVDREKARASVLGRVSAPGSYPILRPDLRLVDLIALAGGHQSGSQVEDLVVRLGRGGASRSLPLDTVLNAPEANIRVQAGDVVAIEGRRHRFSAFGAVGTPGFFEYDRPRLTLADALGRVRGTDTRSAARNGVFVYRAVPTSDIAAFGASTQDFSGPVAPAIYHFNFLSPTMLFAAQEFEMADGDVIYVSDSLITEINKVIGIVTQVVPAPVRFVPTEL